MPFCWNQGYEYLSGAQHYQEFYNETMDQVKFTLYGYKKSLFRKILYHGIAILLLGIPYILYASFLKLRTLKYKKCSVEEATHFFVFDAIGNVCFTKAQFDSMVLPRTADSVQIKSFWFENKKYIWQEERNMFITIAEYLQPLVFDENLLTSTGLTKEDVENRLKLYGPNDIEIEIKSYWMLFIEEVITPFYFFQVFSVTLWFLDVYYSYASCVMVITIASGVVGLIQTRRQNVALHDMVESSKSHTATVMRQMGSRQTVAIIDPTEIVPGDVLILPLMNYTMPCDAILLNGQCIVNESVLTGESVPIMKTPADDSMGFYNLEIHKNVTLFCGTTIIQTRYYGVEKVFAKVIKTGFETSKGSLINSILFPGEVAIKFYRDSYRFVLVLAAVALLGMIYTIYVFVKRDPKDIENIIYRSLDIITIVVPPALPAAIAAGIIYSFDRLKKLGIYCISRSTINVCGDVNLACFDKTGTLTDQGLVMSTVIPCKRAEFHNPVSNVRGLYKHAELLKAMGCCHSLTTLNNDLNGDPIDLEMFKYTGWELEEPDQVETALYDMLSPTVINGTYETLQATVSVSIGILKQFTFCSVFKCMSVICKNAADTNLVAYVKGAPEKMKSICKPASIPKNFYEQLSQYSVQGFRVIGISYKNLGPNFKWTDAQTCEREIIEMDLTFLGFLIFQNPLKPETTPVIRTLHSANLRTVMITGDNVLTAISVGYNCEMIDPQADVYELFVDVMPDNRPIVRLESAAGHNNSEEDTDIINTLDYHLAITGTNWELLMKLLPHVIPLVLVRTKIFARIRPDQKTEVIREFQKIDYVVCMVGDGANDCGALKAAQVGVSLSNAEASVAAPFTSSIDNISCIIHLLLEGRCALVTSFSIFNYMALYSLIQFFSVIILYQAGSNLADYEFFFVDFFTILPLAVTIGNQGPSGVLVPKSPQSSLISPRNIIPLVLQILVCAGMQSGGLLFLYKQPWYEPIPSVGDTDVSWENTVVFTISCYQYLILAIIYSKGKPYRRHLITNGWFILCNVLLVLANSLLMLYPPDYIAKFIGLVIVHYEDTDKFLFRFYLFAFPVVHLILAYIIEICIADSEWLPKFLKFLTHKRDPIHKYKTFLRSTELLESWIEFSGERPSD